MKEIWKYIEGWAPLYEVSNYGRVRRGEAIRKPTRRSHGYFTVGISAPGVGRKTLNLHTLVAKTFVRAPGRGEVVIHADGDKANNRADNISIVLWKDACVRPGRRHAGATPYVPGTGAEPPALAGEEWREVPGYSGRYLASSLGRIWSRHSRHGAGRLFLDRGDTSSYRTLCFTDHTGKRVSHTAHKIVALTFHGPRPEGMFVCHRDDNPRNNRADNLIYGTPAENTANAYALGGLKRGSDRAESILTEEIVRKAREQYRAGANLTLLAEVCGVSRTTIYTAIRGKTWRHVEGAVEPHEVRRKRRLRA